MVQTDLSQLATECSEWRQILRSYREEFHLCRKSLQEICRKTLSRAQLQEVEHFDNQFHIQLINIHDLKQSIKQHEKRIDSESSDGEEGLFIRHEALLSDFLSLENTLQELRLDFQNFITATNC